MSFVWVVTSSLSLLFFLFINKRKTEHTIGNLFKTITPFKYQLESMFTFAKNLLTDLKGARHWTQLPMTLTLKMPLQSITKDMPSEC